MFFENRCLQLFKNGIFFIPAKEFQQRNCWFNFVYILIEFCHAGFANSQLQLDNRSGISTPSDCCVQHFLNNKLDSGACRMLVLLLLVTRQIRKFLRKLLINYILDTIYLSEQKKPWVELKRRNITKEMKRWKLLIDNWWCFSRVPCSDRTGQDRTGQDNQITYHFLHWHKQLAWCYCWY